MEFIKKHLVECILSAIFIVIFFGGIITVYMMWNQSSGSVYGNRLVGIEKVEIKSNKLIEIEKKLKENNIYTDISSKIEGKIINFYITVNTGTKKDEAKKGVESLKTSFSEKELEFYDLQIFIDELDKKEESTYPVIGYKSKKSKEIVWTNNK